MNGRARCGAVVALLGFVVGCAGVGSSPTLSLDGDPVMRGHRELVPAIHGAIPLVLGRDDAPGLCLRTAAESDTSGWEARLWVEPAERRSAAAWSAPTARVGTTLCFDAAIPDTLASGDARLCGEVVDRYDGASRVLSCQPFSFASDDGGRAELLGELPDAFSGGDADSPAAALDALAGRAGARGFPLLELRIRLVAAYVLRRAGELNEADARLQVSPDWLHTDAALAWSALLSYERALVELDRDWALAAAWSELERARSGLERVAHPKRVVVAMKQAEILARVGATAESRERLSRTVDSCRTSAPCDARLLAAAENTRVWLTLQDPDATPDDLADAQTILARAIETGESLAPVERANLQLNDAYLDARRGRDPSGSLVTARRLLAESAVDERAAWLSRWALAVEATSDLERGDEKSALERCRRIAQDAEAPRLAAFAASCQARALRALDRLDEAQVQIAAAVERHGYAESRRLGQSIALGPGQRADDSYLAAGIAADRGDASAAWERLRELDGLLLAQRTDPHCGESAPAPTDDLARAAALERPAAAERRMQASAVRADLLRRAQERVRRGTTCRTGESLDDTGVDYRAFATPDEIFLLGRREDGTVEVVRRTPFERARLIRIVADLQGWLADANVDDATWRARVRPLADALVPPVQRIGPVTQFKVHGALQGVPLEALPLTGRDGSMPEWLGTRTVVAYRPAGASPGVAADRPTASPLFVVDPERNLETADRAAATYRRYFPAADLLLGASATRRSLLDGVADAAWLHVDAHADYDPAFPELSRIRLHDGPLLAGELARPAGALGFANLSACSTGRWPATADSGRFGLAGELTRGGVPWVVGTRADLDDGLAARFNETLYRSLSNGDTLPVAYRRAHTDVVRSHPVARWAALLLLTAGSPAGDSSMTTSFLQAARTATETP